MIPGICQVWAGLMASGKNGEDRILKNLQHEKCIDNTTWHEFFSRLAPKGQPTRAGEAKQWAEEVIQEDPDRFTCRGREIPKNLFVLLFRLEDLKALRWRIPDCLNRFGINDEKLIKELPEEELLSVTDEYREIVRLGGKLGVVLVTDYEIVKDSLHDLEDLVDKLGLRNLVNEDRCVLCVYERNDIGISLHLPRSFDGLDNPQFEIVEDCRADAGKTLPLSLPREQGLPEAVHKKCEIIPKQWRLRPIR